MKFTHLNQEWEVIRATEKPYVRTVDCRLPMASAEKLAKWLRATQPTKIELLGMRAYRDHISRQHHIWGFRVTVNGEPQLLEIAHQPNLTVRNRMRG